MSGKEVVFNRDLQSGTCPAYYNGFFSSPDDIPDLPIFDTGEGTMERVDNGKCPISVTGLDPTIQGNSLTEGAGKTIQVQSRTIAQGFGWALRVNYDNAWNFGAKLIDRGRQAGSTVSDGFWKTVNYAQSKWRGKTPQEIQDSTSHYQEQQFWASENKKRRVQQVEAAYQRIKADPAGPQYSFIALQFAIYQRKERMNQVAHIVNARSSVWDLLYFEFHDPAELGPVIAKFLQDPSLSDQAIMDAIRQEISSNSRVHEIIQDYVVQYIKDIAALYKKNLEKTDLAFDFETLRRSVHNFYLRGDFSEESLDDVMSDAFKYFEKREELGKSKYASILPEIYDLYNIYQNSADKSKYSLPLLAQAIHEVSRELNKEHEGLYIDGKLVKDPEDFYFLYE